MRSKTDKIIYPESFNDDRIIQHHLLTQDLESLLEKSGYIDKFKRMYRQRLKFLADRGKRCIEKSQWFEILKNATDLYSMKVKGQLNIRVIFTFCSDNPSKVIILLCAFHEKKTKDYSDAILVARKRLAEISKL